MPYIWMTGEYCFSFSAYLRCLTIYRPHLRGAGRDGAARRPSSWPHYPLASLYRQTWIGDKVPWRLDWIASHSYIVTVLGIGLSPSGDGVQESLSTAYFPTENSALFSSQWSGLSAFLHGVLGRWQPLFLRQTFSGQVLCYSSLPAALLWKHCFQPAGPDA